MRIVNGRRVKAYYWRRSHFRPNGNPSDSNGVQVRIRIDPWWWNAEVTARTIVRTWQRGKSQVEFNLWRVGLDGKRDRNFRKRFVRITVGTGGQGRSGTEGGANR